MSQPTAVDALMKAVQAEREACAKILDETATYEARPSHPCLYTATVLRECAASIRARGTPRSHLEPGERPPIEDGEPVRIDNPTRGKS